MLGTSKITALLGSAPPATADSATLKAYAKTLQKEAGLALFLVTPMGKTPAECRPRSTMNKEIREAEEQGLPKPTGLHMATHDGARISRFIDRYRKDREPETPVNFATEVGRSRLIVIDVDTEAELAAFRTRWAEAEGNPALAWVAPTVSSPGVQEADGTWVHRGGGHFYFTLPEGYEHPEGTPNVLTFGEAGAQWVARIKDAYVLIPPSVRKEGAYTVAGTDHPAPIWLLEEIRKNGAARAERRAAAENRRAVAAETGEVDSIDAWGITTPWADVLADAGWTFSGRVDSCTCEIWTRPGNPVNVKSATVHGDGCSDGRYDPANPPIHVWSDNVEGGLQEWITSRGKTLSKLQFVAATKHKGDVVKAMRSLGISFAGADLSRSTFSADELRGLEAARLKEMGVVGGGDRLTEAVTGGEASKEAAAAGLLYPLPAPAVVPEPIPAGLKLPEAAPVPEGVTVETLIPGGIFAEPVGPDAEEDPDEPTGDPDAIGTPEGPRRPTLAPFSHWRDMPPPEFIVDGWVEDRALSAFIGPSGVGKSAVVLDMACSIATGVPWHGKRTTQAPVLYVAGEGVAGAVQRVKAWEAEHGLDVSETLYMTNEAILIGSTDRDLWTWLAEQVKAAGIRLVIFDTLARMSLGLEENSASDMGNAVARFDRLRREAETGVMVVHHTARGQTHGRGSTAILGALDSEMLVEEADEDGDPPHPGLAMDGGGPGKLLTATVTKQKNAEDGAALNLTLCARHGSIVVADAYGRTDTSDPFAVPAEVLEFVKPAPPTDTELAVQLAEYVERFPMQGATAQDMVRDVLPPRSHRKDKNAWRGAVKAAVDRGLATGLLRTFGSDGAQRYIRGSATEEEARALDRAEAADRAATGGAS